MVKVEHGEIVAPLREVYCCEHKFDQVIEVETDRALRSNQNLSIIFFRLDKESIFCDSYEKDDIGKIIQKVVDVLSSIISNPDILARLNDGVYAILLPYTDVHIAHACAERVRRILASLKHVNDTLVTASFGVTERKIDEDIHAWFLRTEAHLHEAERKGGNIVKSGRSTIGAAKTRGLFWRLSSSTGISHLDKQKKMIINTINTFSSLARIDNHSVALEVAKRLEGYLIELFSAEEKVYSNINEAKAFEHQKKHSNIMVKFKALINDVESRKSDIESLISFLNKSLVINHFFSEDSIYFSSKWS